MTQLAVVLLGGVAGQPGATLVAEGRQVGLVGVHVMTLLLQLVLRTVAVRPTALRALDLLHLVRVASRLALLAVLLEHHLENENVQTRNQSFRLYGVYVVAAPVLNMQPGNQQTNQPTNQATNQQADKQTKPSFNLNSVP